MARVRSRGTDATGVAALKQTIADMRAEDMTFVVARFERPDAKSFGSAGVTQRIGEDDFYPTVRATVDAFQRTPYPAPKPNSRSRFPQFSIRCATSSQRDDAGCGRRVYMSGSVDTGLG
jgi:hypothetical protein